MRVLLVEDEPDLLDVMDFVLSSRQVDVVRATSRDDALRKIQHGEKIDCIFLDWHMPGMNCENFLATLRTIHPNMPVTLISADHRIARYAARLGVPFLSKPFDVDDFFTTIDRMRHGRKDTGMILPV